MPCLSQLDGAFKQSGEHVEQLARLLVSEMDVEGARRLARVGTEGAGVPAIRLSRETVGFL